MTILRRHRLVLETLEDRVVPSADLVDGVLTVEGTRQSDTIEVRVEDTQIVVDVNGEVSSFEAADVQQLHIRGQSGKDRITVAPEVTVGAEIRGGNGKDTVQGGGGNDTVFGGNGKDDLSGGEGNDELYGENGSDVIDGEDGDDLCKGSNGKDDLFGGSGNDTLVGGRGKDDLDGGEGIDLVDGGKGKDDIEDGFEEETAFQALLTGLGGGTGEAGFGAEQEDGQTDLEFRVEVEDLTPNSAVDVYVDGTLVGQITLDGEGDGRLEFSTQPDAGDGELPFPDGFPDVGEGSVVSIRVGADVLLQGTLQPVASDG